LSGKAVTPAWQNYSERTQGFSRVKDVISGKIYSFSEVEINAGECMVFELLK
jgi:hypothetical protein